MIDVVIGSSSIVTAFAPVDLGERGYLIDAGKIYNLDVQSAVNQCRQSVDDDSQITIDILVAIETPL